MLFNRINVTNRALLPHVKEYLHIHFRLDSYSLRTSVLRNITQSKINQLYVLNMSNIFILHNNSAEKLLKNWQIK